MGSVPMGTIVAFVLKSNNIPAGWLLCDGSPIPSMYQSLITAYGSNTPDLSARTLVASGPSGAQMVDYKLGDTGGEAVHILSESEIPSHTHNFTGYNTNFKQCGDNNADSGSDISAADCGCWSTQATTSFGGGDGHNNMQPYYVVHYIIYTGD